MAGGRRTSVASDRVARLCLLRGGEMVSKDGRKCVEP